MQEQKLEQLYQKCLQELKNIGIDMQDKEKIGAIDIKISTKANKRYGCCKQEDPDENYKIIQKRGYHKSIRYEKFKNHHIEISSWVMQLNDNIAKNTILHELIHCIPYCNNHGAEFKKYANYINEKLGYQIKTRGNRKEDYQASNLIYQEDDDYKYKIICENCKQEIYRKRFNKNLIKKYQCAKCKRKTKISGRKRKLIIMEIYGETAQLYILLYYLYLKKLNIFIQ